MPDYAAMYQKLFAAQADTIEGLKELVDNLIQVHKQVEEMYISSPELIKLYGSINHPYQEGGYRDDNNDTI